MSEKINLLQTDTPHERARKLLALSGLIGSHTSDMASRMAEGVELYMRMDGVIKQGKLDV